MAAKTLLSIGIIIVIGLSPLRNSSLAKILITITTSLTYIFQGGWALKPS